MSAVSDMTSMNDRQTDLHLVHRPSPDNGKCRTVKRRPTKWIARPGTWPAVSRVSTDRECFYPCCAVLHFPIYGIIRRGSRLGPGDARFPVSRSPLPPPVSPSIQVITLQSFNSTRKPHCKLSLSCCAVVLSGARQWAHSRGQATDIFG